MRTLLLASMILTSTPVAAGGLDGQLRKLWRDRERPGAANVAHLFVQTTDVEATRGALVRLGAGIGAVSGDIISLRLPVQRLAELPGAPGVTAIEGARPVYTRLDTLVPAIFADLAHQGSAPLSRPATGAGVIVGVIDAGLSYDHDAFKNEDGSTRVLALWDMDATGTPPAGFTYGTTCSGAEIDAGACSHSTDQDHGTHVAGIAAGSTVGPYTGVAPAADIVFVNLADVPGQDMFTGFTNAVCDGVRYIFDVATAEGKPAVVNMSLGAHWGPHDGTSLADQCLDNASGPGRILVAAAGNEGQGSTSPWGAQPRVFVHAGGTAGGAPVRFSFAPDENLRVIGVVWWDPPAEITVRIGFRDDQGDTGWTGTASLTTAVSQMINTASYTVGGVDIDGETTAAGPRALGFTLSDANMDNEEAFGTWFLEVSGSGRFDAFIDTTSAGGFTQPAPAGFEVDSRMTVGFPAIASSVLSVGSFVTRNGWTSSVGNHAQTDGLTGAVVELDDLSGFSSRGPSRNPTITGWVPDITAPGEIIASALATNYDTAMEMNRVLAQPPNGFLLSDGTSMASPAAAGVVALMLEQNPNLDADAIRANWDETAGVPPGTAVPNDDWGRGKIDAAEAVANLQGPAGIDEGCGCSSGAGTFWGVGVLLAARWRRRRSRA